MPLAQAELGIEFLLHPPRQGKIKVLSTQEQVLANRSPLELDIAPCDVRAHKTKVGRAAADVADEDNVTIPQLRRSFRPICRDPRIKRCQRFLQQREPLQAGSSCAFYRKFTRLLIERCRHRDNDLLVFEQQLRTAVLSSHRMVPCISQMYEVSRRSVDGRDHGLR